MVDIMNTIKKKILTDEESRPVAVQIDYEDWLEIERQLQLRERDETDEAGNGESSSFKELLQKTRGAGNWKGGDGLDYQERLRKEWNGSSGGSGS